MKKTPIRKRGKKHGKEWARKYGSVERVEWISAHRCHMGLYYPRQAECAGEVENAHTVTGGMGRKADAKTIIPACHTHHEMYDQHIGWLADRTVRAEIIGAAAGYELAWSTRA